jgi:hypothetical protein
MVSKKRKEFEECFTIADTNIATGRLRLKWKERKSNTNKSMRCYLLVGPRLRIPDTIMDFP